ncbi:MAG: molybdopterin-dependent oxidoreductase [Planctomycetaceae bacterium]|nr:molybdopterin-dependent oxidoreductase [Planctomycetaceae bacterium]
MAAIVLTVSGLVEHQLELTHEQLRRLPARMQIPDLGQLAPPRTGRAVWLSGLLSTAGTAAGANRLLVKSSRDGFSAAVPLEAVRERGLLIYEDQGQPLGEDRGGPVRFLVPDAAACGLAEVDTCANVKYVDHLEVATAADGEM